MWHRCAKDSLVLIQVCSIVSKEQYQLEDLPHLLIPSMLTQDICVIVLPIDEGEAYIAGGDCLTYPME